MMTSIENATSLGMYYIIDWGTLNENPADRQAEAVEYFSMLAEKYRNNPYLIFEICNEPAPDIWNRTEGTGGVRTDAEAVIGAIRAKESDALVIVAPDGSATNISDWVSSSIASNDPIDDPINTLLSYNVAYTFHLYAWNYEYSTTTTHYGYRIRDAIEAGLTVIYTEFSPAIATMDAQYSGRLEMDTKEADKYLNLALEYDMSYMFFRYISFFASQETSSQHMFEKGHKNEMANGSWTYEMLTDSGKWFYDNALHTDGFTKHADYNYVPPVR
jgi:endoglucanase